MSGEEMLVCNLSMHAVFGGELLVCNLSLSTCVFRSELVTNGIKHIDNGL